MTKIDKNTGKNTGNFKSVKKIIYKKFCNRVYSTSEFSGLKLPIFSQFPKVLVTYKRHNPFILVCFLSIFVLILGVSKIDVKKAEIRQ